MLLLATTVMAGCHEAPTAAPAPAPRYRTHFRLANATDSLVSLGYFAVLDDTLADTTMRHGTIWVQPFAQSNERSSSGPLCHLGCIISMRVDLYWARRSFQFSRTLATPADTLISFVWPRDTTAAIEVRYEGDKPQCLQGPIC